MATFSERKGTWQAKVVRKGFPTQYKSFDTKAKAQVWARAVEVAMDNGTWGDPAGSADVIFGDLLKRYHESVTPTKRSRSSESYRLAKLRRRKIADYSMRNLTTHVLGEYRDERLKEGATSATVCRELASICAVITHAQREWGLKLGNPAKLVKKPRLPPGRNRSLKPHEIERLLQELHPEAHKRRHPLLHPVVQFALETAMRRGEILNLVWRNVDFGQRTAFLPLTKNGKARTVPLSSRAVEILGSLPRTDETLVFPISDYALECAFVRACKRAEIENFHFHDLRHMATTELSKKLPNVIELASVTGHSNVQMLSRYYHTTAADLALKIG
ncbi:site-specific integrase [Cupriavidus pauculus]|uniref:site-specific integrase n=1 Tax=Cupriavidus pauculus TaxID=82633 RepID=UPI0012486491|nr:site-specific integrase [Cupriavidus pauculus]KAB0598073.1 site-specific integrase [Cupriavidus pauculus]UAK98476.1 site-specific integrase [Cupriavidus pauculus]